MQTANESQASVAASARNSSPRRTRALVSLAACGLVFTALCLRFAPVPWIWIGWGWTSVLVVAASHARSTWLRAILVNVALLTAVVAGAETYLTLRPPPHTVFSDGYMVEDDALGTAPARNAKGHSIGYEHGKVAYDVTYTIDADGLRIAPPLKTATPTSSVLFFGCSFTYGEGLQDDQTLPYQTGILSGGQYPIYNFSFHGYAPNQMMSAIETGRVKQTVRTPPRTIIYTALPDHIARVVGKIPYGRHSPHYAYVLQPDGTVHFDGHFDDAHQSRLEASIRGQLRKSALYLWIDNVFRPSTNDDDLRLLLALVRQSRNRLKADYPDAEFHIILWRNFPYEQKTYEKMQAGFAEMHIPVHLVENILPGYNSNPKQYWLTGENAHPNALANRLIAQYVTEKILRH